MLPVFAVVFSYMLLLLAIALFRLQVYDDSWLLRLKVHIM
jgi:hypothetical protein